MHELPPYVQATSYMAVRALLRGILVDGVVFGWRRDRVYLQWRSDMGNHLAWVPAADVERKERHLRSSASRGVGGGTDSACFLICDLFRRRLAEW